MVRRNVQGVQPPTQPSFFSSKPVATLQREREITKTVAQKMWLFSIHLINTIGWGYIFGWTIYHTTVYGGSSLKYVFVETKPLMALITLLSLADVVHEYIGWARDEDLNIFESPQAFSFRRLHLFFFALWYIPEVQYHTATGIMLTVWAFTGLLRHPFYLLNSFNMSPQFFSWFRYSAFAVVYPVSFVSEIIVWLLMLPYISEKELHSFPSVTKFLPSFRFGYFYFVIVFLSYSFITFPIEYRRILRDRRRKLFGEPIELKPQEKSDEIQNKFNETGPVTDKNLPNTSAPRESLNISTATD